MTKKTSHAAKHAFLYLTSFMTLALVAVNVGVLFFQIINFSFPLEFSEWQLDFSQSALKFGIASLLVAAPVYYFITRLINRNISKKDLDQDSGIRKWLTYIVLFLTVAIVIGDLVTAVYSFLDGEITIRFFLKVLTILAIAGGIFAYYVTDMKNENEKKRRQKNNIWAIVFWAFVLIPFISAFFLIETPQTTRLKKIDTQTLNDLQQVQYQIDDFYRVKGEMPQTIDDLKEAQFGLISMTHLEEKNFSYSVTGSQTYELCADFERANLDDDMREYRYSYGIHDYDWKHDMGNHCFPFTAEETTK